MTIATGDFKRDLKEFKNLPGLRAATNELQMVACLHCENIATFSYDDFSDPIKLKMMEIQLKEAIIARINDLVYKNKLLDEIYIVKGRNLIDDMRRKQLWR